MFQKHSNHLSKLHQFKINTEIKLALIAVLLFNHLSTSKSSVNPGHHYWVELLH